MEDNNLLLLINDDGTAKLAPEYNVTIYFDTEKERDDFCEKLKEMDKHRWIPCNKRLPEKEMEVLITADRWSNVIDDWIEDDVIHTYWNNELQMFDYSSRNKFMPEPIIKAWMPLPEAYKDK